MSGKQEDKALVARYAKALFAAARDQGSLQETEDNIRKAGEIFAASAAIRRLVQSPVFSRAEQAKAIGAVLEQDGVSAMVREFFAVLASNRRLALFPAIQDAFLTLLSKERGEVTVEVVAARVLHENQLSGLRAALEGALKQKLRVKTTVDPAILGGLVVKIGSTMIDDSLKSKLERLQAASKKAIATL